MLLSSVIITWNECFDKSVKQIERIEFMQK